VKTVGERACKRCGEIIPREAVTNRLVAKLAQRPGVDAIMLPSIWPDAPAHSGVMRQLSGIH
jgi:hypothetical protein